MFCQLYFNITPAHIGTSATVIITQQTFQMSSAVRRLKIRLKTRHTHTRGAESLNVDALIVLFVVFCFKRYLLSLNTSILLIYVNQGPRCNNGV